MYCSTARQHTAERESSFCQDRAIISIIFHRRTMELHRPWKSIRTVLLSTVVRLLSTTFVLVCSKLFKLRQDPPPPLEAILAIFGRRALIFFCLKALGKKWKLTPLLCACAVVITLETQKCRKRAPRSVEFHFFINCDRLKQFSQNERRRADLQNLASDFLIFALGFSYDLSKFSDDFTPFFRLWKTITKSLGKN